MPARVVSFNVNGLRSRLHQLEAVIALHSPDIIGLQETKVSDQEFPHEAIRKLGYEVCFHGQKGHYGVALLSKSPAITVTRGFPLDSEGSQRRMIHGEYLVNGQTLHVINGYFPQGESRIHPTKFPAKEKFYADLWSYLKLNFKTEDALIVMGDMNVAPQDIDVGIAPDNAKRWLKTGKCSFQPEEREWLKTLMDWGFKDTFRELHPTREERYSWFDYRSKGFPDNRGLRIDVVLATPELAKTCVESDVDYGLRGIEKPSDHAPIWSTFE